MAFDAYVHERNIISDLALLRVVQKAYQEDGHPKEPKDCQDDPAFWFPKDPNDEKKTYELQYATLKEGLPFLGEIAYACGFPRDADSKDKNEICVTRGVVSRISRSKFPFIADEFENTTIQIDAATNVGVLGGMALDEYGEVIGMPVHYTPPNDAQLQSYLIPSDTILNFIRMATDEGRFQVFHGFYGLDQKILSSDRTPGSLQPIGYSPSALEFYGLSLTGDDTGLMAMNEMELEFTVDGVEGRNKLHKRDLVTHLFVPYSEDLQNCREHKISNDGFTKIYEDMDGYADPGIEVGHFVSTCTHMHRVGLTTKRGVLYTDLKLYKNIPVSQSPEYFVEVHYMVLSGYVLFEKSSASLRELFNAYQNLTRKKGARTQSGEDKPLNAEAELVQGLEDGEIFVYRTAPTQTTRGNEIRQCYRVRQMRGMSVGADGYKEEVTLKSADLRGMKTFMKQVNAIEKNNQAQFLALDLELDEDDRNKDREVLMLTQDIEQDSREAADLLNLRHIAVPSIWV
jgi:hypothetical protein